MMHFMGGVNQEELICSCSGRVWPVKTRPRGHALFILARRGGGHMMASVLSVCMGGGGSGDCGVW